MKEYETAAEAFAVENGLPTKMEWLNQRCGGAYLTYEVRECVTEAFEAGVRWAIKELELFTCDPDKECRCITTPEGAANWLDRESEEK